MSSDKPADGSGGTARVYRNPTTGLFYKEVGEAFGHPTGAREGRFDVVFQQIGGKAGPEFITLPFAELHGAAAPPALELVTDPTKVPAPGVGGPVELGEARCYRHYKGKFYQELGSATGLLSGAQEVLYRTLYPSNFALFTRPLGNFEEEVGEPPAKKRRFAKIAQEEVDAESRKRLRTNLEFATAPQAAPPGRVALVTGASAGLGKVTAKLLAREGYLVFAAARGAEKLAAELREEAETPLRVVPLSMDVRSAESVRAAFQEVKERAGRLDVLVNNAGVLVVGTVEMVSIEQAQDLFETNLFGAMRCMQEALALMREQKSGCIVNVSTIFAEIPTMNQPVYAASKAALDALTLGTREAVRPFGITVHSLQPGGITDTAIGGNLRNGDRFTAEANPYPIDAMVKESVFDKIIPNGQKSEDVARSIADIALGKIGATLVQTSDFTRDLAEKKLRDSTGDAVVALRY